MSVTKSVNTSVESKKVDNASRFPLQISCARFAVKDAEKQTLEELRKEVEDGLKGNTPVKKVVVVRSSIKKMKK